MNVTLDETQPSSLPNLVFYCDLSHSFAELLVMADSRFNAQAINRYESGSAEPSSQGFAVYRTLQVGSLTERPDSTGESVIVSKGSRLTFRPKDNTWEYGDRIKFTCRRCELKDLTVDKRDLALWLDPLISSEQLETGSKGDYLVSLASVWHQFKGIDRELLVRGISAKRKRLH